MCVLDISTTKTNVVNRRTRKIAVCSNTAAL